MSLDRRTFLGLAAAGAATAAAGCRPEPMDVVAATRSPKPPRIWSGVVEALNWAFPAGVSAGDPTPDGVLLWTHHVGGTPLRLSWALFDGEGWGDPTEVDVEVGPDGFVHHELTDLPADAWVGYQFHDDEGGSVVGRFVTPIASDSTAPVQFGACSCLDQGHRAFPALEHAVKRGPLDAFFFLGDTAYFDAQRTREDFRALYRRNLSAPGFDELLRRTSSIFTWDDHEFSNNFDPTTMSQARFDLAVDAFLEHLPVRRDPAHRARIWRSFRFGRTAEVFVLDCRTERDRSAEQYVSEEQLSWLIEGLQRSDATWKLVLNSVPMIGFTNAAWNIPELFADRWQAFEAQRSRLIEAMADLTGVMFVSGDVHCAIAGRVDVDGPGNRIWDIVAGPGGSFLNPTAGFLIDEQIPYAAAMHNAARIHLDHGGTAIIEYVGEEDQTWARLVLDDTGELLELAWTDPFTGEEHSGLQP